MAGASNPVFVQNRSRFLPSVASDSILAPTLRSRALPSTLPDFVVARCLTKLPIDALIGCPDDDIIAARSKGGDSVDQSPGLVHQLSSAADKIALFRSLFRGREDVYPRRFESRKTGKSGYALACAHEWVRGICEKPRIKCADCAHRHFLPVTHDVIRWHLSGCDDAGQTFVAGVYPMLLDETCFFLAVDFDKSGWLEDSAAFVETCGRMGRSAALERSRSGLGGHAWLFFEEAVPATLARKVGSYILTETMERRPDIGFDSYDRFFPNQDTLPHGGFGNLIALPLQKHARGDGNSVFLDEQGVPHPDQWAFLSTLQRIGRPHLEAISRDADRRGRVLGVRLPPAEDDEPAPWAAPPSRRRAEPPIVGELPRSLELILGNEIYIAKDGLGPGLRNRLLRVAAFQNPEFYKTRRCAFRPTPSRGSSDVLKNIHNTSACRADASKTHVTC